jgi:hypothetical protein
MKSAKLLLRRAGRDAVSVDAYIDAATRHAHTITFIETDTGNSICGGYLDPARVNGDFVYTEDPGRRSFVFTLKNCFGVVPTKFRLTGGDYAAYTNRGNHVSSTGGS